MGILNLPPSTSDSKIVKSLKFPFQRGADGFPSLADPAKVIFYHITSLLLSAVKERVMNPSYGVNVHSYIFENLTPIMMARISSVVTGAIEEWEPNAKVLKVAPSIEGEDRYSQTTIIFDISYRIANQNNQMQVGIPMNSISVSGA